MLGLLSEPNWVQISKVLGARVVAVARGSAKANALRELGADVVIDSSATKDEPLRKLIKVHPPRSHMRLFFYWKSIVWLQNSCFCRGINESCGCGVKSHTVLRSHTVCLEGKGLEQ